MKKFMIFAAGIVVGSAVTWKLVKDKYEKIAQEEIDSVKELYSKKYNNDKSNEPTSDDESNEPTSDDESNEQTNEDNSNDNSSKELKHEYSKMTNMYKEKTPQEMVSEMASRDSKKSEKPYIISEDEFGSDEENYNPVTYLYFKNDDILVEFDTDEDVYADEVENLVGYDWLECFDNDDCDAVYVRNESLKLDIEILLDLRDYEKDVRSKMPPTPRVYDEIVE